VALYWEEGAGSLSNTMSSGPRPTSVPSGILIHVAIWSQQIWPENWGFCPLFRERGWVPMQHKVPWAEAYLHTQ